MEAENTDDEMDDIENKDIIEKYNLDKYDEDSEGELGTTSLNSLATLTVFASEEDDPYLQEGDNQEVKLAIESGYTVNYLFRKKTMKVKIFVSSQLTIYFLWDTSKVTLQFSKFKVLDSYVKSSLIMVLISLQ